MNSVEKISYFIENVKRMENMIWKIKNFGKIQIFIIINIIGRVLGYDINFLTFGAGGYQVVSRTSKFGYCFSSSCFYEPREHIILN